MKDKIGKYLNCEKKKDKNRNESVKQQEREKTRKRHREMVYAAFGFGTGRPDVRSTLQHTTLRTTRVDVDGVGCGDGAIRSGDVNVDLLGVDTRLSISRRLRVVSPSVAAFCAAACAGRTGECSESAVSASMAVTSQ